MHAKIDQIGTGRYTVAADYLAAFLEFVTESGVDASAILLDAGLTPESIIQQPQFVGDETFNRALRSLLNHHPDPHHAYRFARRLSELQHGTAGIVAQNSATMREATNLGIRFARPQMGNTNRLQLRTEGDNMRLVVRPPNDPTDATYDQELDCFTAIIILLGHEIRGRRMTGTMDRNFCNELKVTHSSQHFSLAKAGLPPGLILTFDAPQTELVLHSDYLNTPLLAPSIELQAVALRQLEHTQPSANISDRVRAVFEQFESDIPDLDTIAEALHVSRATLKRKLKTNGTTYQDIKDSFRLRQANYLLQHTDATVDDIGAQLGFSDASGFSKAFRRWSGLSPSDWRLAQRTARKKAQAKH